MKLFRSIFLLVVLMSYPLFGFSQEVEKEEGGVNLKEILFGHVQDSYQWHITDIGGEPLILNLPMIFYSPHSGFHIYCSSQFAHEPDANLLREGPDGFYIKGAEDEKGKIMEMVDGQLEPIFFDFSITKTVMVLFINAILNHQPSYEVFFSLVIDCS